MDVIILAAGMGTRAKLNFPKQLMRLGGKPLIIHAVELFNDIEDIENIIITVIPNEIDCFKKILESYGYSNCICVKGGDTRQESVFNGLKFCKSERVIIHEAARPFVKPSYIKSLISINAHSVVPCFPVTSTVYYKDKYLERDDVCLIQLPQIFNTSLLKQAHEKGTGKHYTDDSSLMFFEMGIEPYRVLGIEENIKITTPTDIIIAEVLYNETCNYSWRE